MNSLTRFTSLDGALSSASNTSAKRTANDEGGWPTRPRQPFTLLPIRHLVFGCAVAAIDSSP